MSEYDNILAEAKLRGSGLAKEFIPRLYKELVEVENLDPKDAGERIKKDLIDVWARTTIYENLPDEAKQEVKQEAGKQSHKNVLETSATNTGSDSSTVTVQRTQSNNDNSTDYDELAEKYNGLQEHNDYLEDEIKQLKQTVQALQTAGAKLVVQATPTAGKVQQATAVRNPNRGYWIKFDLSNVEITRPLINIIMRMKDRPKQFYFEILGDDVIEVSEKKQ